MRWGRVHLLLEVALAQHCGLVGQGSRLGAVHAQRLMALAMWRQAVQKVC